MMLGLFRSVHEYSFERSNAERVAERWDKFARLAVDIGHTDLWAVAKHGADSIRELRDLQSINKAHLELLKACETCNGYSDVRWKAGHL